MWYLGTDSRKDDFCRALENIDGIETCKWNREGLQYQISSKDQVKIRRLTEIVFQTIDKSYNNQE